MMQPSKHHFHCCLQAPLCGVRRERSLAAPKRVYEDDAFQHVDEHVYLGIFPSSIALRRQQERFHGGPHRPEHIMQNIAMVSAKMMEFSEEDADDGQALIHEPVLKLCVMQ
jgi:hypothetical protein